MSKFRSILPDQPGRNPNQRPGNAPRDYKTNRYGSGRGPEQRDRAYEAGARRRPRNLGPGLSRSKKSSQYIYYAILGFIVLLIVWAGWRLVKTSRNLKEVRLKQESLEEEKQQLQTSVNELKNQLKLVNTDEYIEQYAHDKLGMIRPNEILVQTADGKYQINQAALAALNGGRTNSENNGEENGETNGENNGAGENNNTGINGNNNQNPNSINSGNNSNNKKNKKTTNKNNNGTNNNNSNNNSVEGR